MPQISTTVTGKQIAPPTAPPRSGTHTPQPFTMPDVRTPTDALLNPHQNAARHESTVWARGLGMIDAPGAVWTRRDLADHDYALMCSYIHPTADARELTLITEWYVWVFYFDDWFLQRFKKAGDHAGAVAALDRLTRFPPDADTTAGNPVKAGLADLWARTAPDMSICWRKRFSAVTQDLLQESLTELEAITARRVPDPIEYIELRRRVGGAPWSAALVEHTVGEIPEHLAGARPVRVMTETFADAVHLRNDLFSYQREVDEEDEPHNAVLVTERFFGCPTQQAANVVADLIASRLRLFEHAATTEVAELAADGHATTDDRLRLAAYAQGLRDWQAGGHEWHSRSSRYMNTATRHRPSRAAPVATGPGTAAARLVRPVTGLRPEQISSTGPHPPLRHVPPPQVPFPLRLSPHLDHLRGYIIDWCERMGMFEPTPGVRRSQVWLPRDVVEFDIALCSAGVFPDASREDLETVTCWLHLTYIDDYYPAVYGHADRAEARAFLDCLFSMLAPGASRAAPRNAPERMIADLWQRTVGTMPRQAVEPLRQGARRWLLSVLWEHRYIHGHTTPDPVDFIEMGRSTFGGDFMLAMIHARHPGIPAEVYSSTPMTVFDEVARDVFRLINEVVSYTKETAFEDENLNGVVVFSRFLGIDVDTAADVIARLLDSRCRQMQRIIDHDLPLLCRRRDLSAEVVTALNAYTRTITEWVAGIAHWHRQTGRYDPGRVQTRYERLRRYRLGGPHPHQPTAHP